MKNPSRPVNHGRRLAVDGGIGRTLHRGLAALFPATCLLCGETCPARLQRDRLSGTRLDLCQACAADLPWTASACRRCALPLEQEQAMCGRCLKRPPHFQASYCALNYQVPVDGLITGFKFHHQLNSGRLLAHLLAMGISTLAGEDSREAEDVTLVPVPLHYRRAWRRGFNQSAMLAADLGRLLGLPLWPGLRRQRATRRQSELPAGRRSGNVRGAFTLARSAPPPPACVALVDDVMTTGNTLNECARVLRQGGVREVRVWCVARAPGLSR